MTCRATDRTITLGHFRLLFLTDQHILYIKLLFVYKRSQIDAFLLISGAPTVLNPYLISKPVWGIQIYKYSHNKHE